MLQQTTVKAVIPFYNRFLDNFPEVSDLAKAKDEKVLSLWSGLGYYSRARNLQKAAKIITAQKHFPKSYTALLELPGIGPYTAAAIASIAFNEEVAAIDGNVIRVISRLFDIKDDVSSQKGKDLIALRAHELMKGQPPSQHNQAMMELGATICQSKNPNCFLCPVRKYCQAYKAQNPTSASREKRKNRTQEPWLWEMFFVQNKAGEFALVKKENGTPWLKHLWILPGIAKAWGKEKDPDAHFRHSITHHKIFVKLRAGKLSDISLDRDLKWVHPKNLEKLGVSSVVLKAFKHWEEKMKYILIFGLASIIACSSTEPPQVKETKSAPSVPVTSSNLVPITKKGESQMGKFSPDGTKIIYQSRGRPNHKGSQIYVMNLGTSKERRVTYNDGDDFSPSFDATGKNLYYSSTTDEMKEHPTGFVSPNIATVNPTEIVDPSANFEEIYQSDIDGSHIKRLTQSVGFDGNPSPSPDGQHTVFVSQRGGNFETFTSWTQKAEPRIEFSKAQM